MKKYQLYGVGHAIMDIIAKISDQHLIELGLRKAGMTYVSEEMQEKIVSKLENQDKSLISGGSVANSVVSFQQLGGNAAFAGLLGDDEFGKAYLQQLQELGVEMDVKIIPNRSTGSSIIVVTPDAERTMNTSLGISSEISASHLTKETVVESEWFYVEGYLLCNPSTGFTAANQGATYSKASGNKVALTFSDTFLVKDHRQRLDTIIDKSDLVFANIQEAQEYTGISDDRQVFNALKKRVKNVVMTRSEKSVFIHFEGKDLEIPAFSCKPVDLTGAGDMFAGAFLYGITNGYSPEESGRAASYLSMKIITQVGARLNGDIKKYWKEAIS